ncbi:hypothetical protein NTE19_003362 [Vibrio fluvialis]|nr:hypothetical protein [Vibrio fluvialis]
MGLTSNSLGNKALVKANVLALRALGERLNNAGFVMAFSDAPDMTLRVSSTQLAEMKRQMIEGYGPLGVMVNQQGNLMNAGEITVQVDEYLDTRAARFICDAVDSKKYFDWVTISLVAEDAAFAPLFTQKLEDVWLGSDALDLSVEDVTTTTKWSMTLNYNWVEKAL